jgi:hypothetical protein
LENSRSDKANLILGSILLVVLIVVGWWALGSISSYFLGLDKSVASSIIAGLFAMGALLFSFWKERAKTFQENHRGKKVEVYSIFFDLISDVIKNSNKDSDKSSNESNLDEFLKSAKLKDQMFDLWKGVTFYGSPQVIKALNDWKFNISGDNDSIKIMKAIGSILLAMRKDIGLSNSGLTSLTIHQIYINEDLREISKI